VKVLWGGFAVAVLAFGLVSPAHAEEEKLVFALNNPATSNFTQQAIMPWVERINAKGAGILKIDPRPGFVLTNFNNYYDRVQADVVQIGWGLQSAVGGKFQASEVAGLPWGELKSEIMSVALYRLIKSGVLDSEYANTVPLLINSFPGGGIHFSARPPSLDNYAGLKIQSSGKLQSELISLLGGTSIATQPGEIYESLQRGVIQGTSTGWVAFGAFKLAEVTFHHIDNVPKATSVGIVMMSRKKFNALSPAAQKILLEAQSEQEVRSFGAFWDRDNAFERNRVAAMAGHTVVDMPAEQSAQLVKKFEPVFDRWAADVPNGKAVLEKYRELLAQVQREPTLGK
jgi:TRAP-type transport system periplasmic protein